MSTTPTPDPQPQGDPYTEPANSTVEDWHGQEVDRDVEAADEALAAAGGDETRAEELFEQARPDHPSDDFKVPEEQRPQ
jgi:hypothetical protein